MSADQKLQEIIETGQRTSKGCAVCGGESFAVIQVRLRLINTARGFKDHNGRSRTHSKTFCADHALTAWEESASWPTVEKKQ